MNSCKTDSNTRRVLLFVKTKAQHHESIPAGITDIEKIEKEMADLNKEKDRLTNQLHDSSLNYDEIQKLSNRFTQVTDNLQSKEFRWLELSEIE